MSRSRHNSAESSEGEDERAGYPDNAMTEEPVSTLQAPGVSQVFTADENGADNRESRSEEDESVLRDQLGRSLLEEDQSLETGDGNVATPLPHPHDVERSAENNNNKSNNDSEATCPVCSADDSVQSQYLREGGELYNVSVEESDAQHTDPEVLSSGGVHLDPGDVPVAVGGPIPQDSGSDEDSGASSPGSSTAPRSSMETGGFINPNPNISENDLIKPTQETTRQAELRTAEQFLRSPAYVRCLELIYSPDSPEGQRLRNIFGLDWIIFVLPALMKVRLQVTGDEQTDASQGLREHLEEEMRRKAESLAFINQLKEHRLRCSCTAVDEGCILISLRAKDVSTLKTIIQRNERGTLSSCFEKILVSDKMRSLAAAQGKKLSVKVSLENKDEIKEAVELLGNLAAPEKNEGQGLVDKITVTYCPEEGKWYWTPDAIEGVWMEANIRTASRGMYVDIPLIEKLKKVLDWLQRRDTFQSGQPQPCYMCYLRHRKAAEETAVTGSL